MTDNHRARLRIVLVGEEAAGVQALRLLMASRELIDIVAVATSLEQSRRGGLVPQAAQQFGIEVMSAAVVRDASFASWLVSRDVDVLLNVHSLFVLHESVVTAPRIGSFNLHPGPLPGYAGLNCPSWAVYNGERTHGVTLHWMDAGIDTGKVAYAEEFAVSDGDTGLAVAASCIRQGIPLIGRLIADATRAPSEIPAMEQDVGRRRYYGTEVPHDGRVLWTSSALEIDRFIRAADYFPFPSPWGHPSAEFRGTPVGIVKTIRTRERTTSPPGTLREGGTGARRVATSDEWLTVTKVVVEGRYLKAAEALPPVGCLDDGRTAMGGFD